MHCKVTAQCSVLHLTCDDELKLDVCITAGTSDCAAVLLCPLRFACSGWSWSPSKSALTEDSSVSDRESETLSNVRLERDDKEMSEALTESPVKEAKFLQACKYNAILTAALVNFSHQL